MRALLLSLLTLPMALLPLPAAADAGATSFFGASVVDTENTPLALDTLRGKPLVVNFWARWCGPCRKEIPDLVEMDAKYRSKGLLILGLAIEDAEYREAVRDFAKAYGVDYRVLLASARQRQGRVAIYRCHRPQRKDRVPQAGGDVESRNGSCDQAGSLT
jgi:thiol-disulfide isomerase/thioredoxin